MNRPDCFGVFRSPQSDAEHDCISCPHDDECLTRAYAMEIIVLRAMVMRAGKALLFFEAYMNEGLVPIVDNGSLVHTALIEARKNHGQA